MGVKEALFSDKSAFERLSGNNKTLEILNQSYPGQPKYQRLKIKTPLALVIAHWQITGLVSFDICTC